MSVSTCNSMFAYFDPNTRTRKGKRGKQIWENEWFCTNTFYHQKKEFSTEKEVNPDILPQVSLYHSRNKISSIMLNSEFELKFWHFSHIFLTQLLILPPFVFVSLETSFPVLPSSLVVPEKCKKLNLEHQILQSSPLNVTNKSWRDKY